MLLVGESNLGVLGELVLLCLTILIVAHSVKTDFTVVFVHTYGLEGDLGLIWNLVEFPGVA